MKPKYAFTENPIVFNKINE
jgi:cytochrome c oxidase assembly protein subunit 15